jgi:hypothetical protein
MLVVACGYIIRQASGNLLNTICWIYEKRSLSKKQAAFFYLYFRMFANKNYDTIEAMKALKHKGNVM